MGSCFRGVIAYVGGLPWADPSSQLGAALGESPPTIVGYRHFLYSMRSPPMNCYYTSLRYCNQVVLWARVEKLGWMCISRLTQTTQILFADLEKGKGNLQVMEKEKKRLKP